MKKILFLIHDLGPGGAEKVLVNLVNNMDSKQFDITVMALFGGVNEQFLKPHIKYRTVFPKPFPGNSHFMKLFSPKRLHKWLIKDHYDIEVSYLEGPCARIISSCSDPSVKKVGWIHIEQLSKKRASSAFRSYKEALTCYSRFDRIVCVSQTVREDFLKLFPISVPTQVLYNTNETASIREKSQDGIGSDLLSHQDYRLIGVGKLVTGKGFDRMIRIQKRLLEEGCSTHLYIMGSGPMKSELERLASQYGISSSVTLLGYQTNPYKYVANCDLFVCASHAEGFSTAATEALIVGTPVCTVEVSGMKELLGENNEWGIVTANDDEALYQGIKKLLDSPALLQHYREKAIERGKAFSTEETVRATQQMLLNL